MTDSELVKEIAQSEGFSSNRLSIKFKNSNLPAQLEKSLKDFYDSWIMYQDGETHKRYRKLTQDLLNKMMRNLNESEVIVNIEQMFGSLNFEKEEIAEKIEEFCKETMASLFGLPKKDYLELLAISKPITKIMYSNLLNDREALDALKAISDVEKFLNKLSSRLSEDSLIRQAIISPEIPTGLIINLLIDGEDPLESFMKSIVFLWASEGFSDYSADMMSILKRWAPFTSISRVCTQKVTLLEKVIQPGERVLGILAMPEDIQNKPMAFGSGRHRCLGEGLAMRISRLLYNYLNRREDVYLESYETNTSFGYFTFTKIIVSQKIYVFDLDGTLVFNGKIIDSAITKELLRINKGSKIIFASARPIRDMLPLLEKFPNNDLIGGNGSIIRKNNEIIPTKTLSEKVLRAVEKFVTDNNLEYVIDYDWDYTAFVSEKNSILTKLDVNQQARNVPLRYDKVIKVIVFGLSKKQFENLKLGEKLTILYHEDTEELVITGDDIDKYKVLQYFIGKKEYVAFGNDKNDIDLLKNAKESVSVGGNQEIFQITKEHLSASNEEISNFLSQIEK